MLARSRRARGSAYAADRPPRLILRFAIYTAIVLGVAGTVIAAFAFRYATARSEEAVRFHTDFIAQTILHRNLRPADLARPVTGARLGELDQLFDETVLIGGVVMAKLYSPEGLVTYSTDHSLIGTKPGSDAIPRVLEGELVSDISRAGDEGGEPAGDRVLEAYVPVRLGTSLAPTGVFEVYNDYGPVSKAARDASLPITIVMFTVLLALYAALFPMLKRTARRLREHVSAIRHQALHDALTGLPNRDLFGDRAEQALARARRDADSVAILLLDLDRFKEINDTLGHRSGDRVLEAAAAALSEVARDSDTVARLGGDEFGVVAPGTDGEGALALAERLLLGLARPIVVDEIELDVVASIGISLFPQHGVSPELLLRHADVAMYVAKETHRPEVYAAERDQYSPERLTLVTGLRRAITSGELVVHYQPQADVFSGRIRSVEALVRWEHPTLGLLGPDRFIPVAEHTGLIRLVTTFVLDTALCQSHEWTAAGLDVGVAVNVSARDLMDLTFPDEVAAALDRWQVAPDRLALEITENAILTDPARARQVLERLSDLGVTLAIDDFGSGHSSLGYLKRLPVDVLKIDKSFVLNMAADENDAVIVRSTVDLGHNLGLRVVAEGVEDDAAWEALEQLRCDMAQGFLISRPVTAAEATRLLARSALDGRPAAATG